MNEVMLTVVGNVVADPELSETRNGAPFATFRIASTSRRYDKAIGGWVNGETLFMQVRCWRGLAMNAATALAKGTPVVVQGKMYTRTVMLDTPEGEKRRTYTDLDAVAIGVDLARVAVAEPWPVAADADASPGLHAVA